MTAALGIGWHIGRRHRIGLVILLTGFLGLVALRHIPGIATGAIVGASLWFGFGLLYLLAVFTQPEVDITAPGSGYPKHLFVLPIQTYQLVLWPMFFGVCAVFLGWLGLSGLVMNAGANTAPLLWPGCMLAAALACLQALFWSPLRFPQLRIVIAIGLLSGMIYLGAFNEGKILPAQLAVGSLAVIPMAFGIAVLGVSKARMSDIAVRDSEPKTRRKPVRIRSPFDSSRVAQLWYEWRRGGIALPVVAGVIVLVLSIPLYFNIDRQSIVPGESLRSNIYVLIFLPMVMRTIAFLSWIIGCSVRFTGARGNNLALPAFIAMRPISSHSMVVARMRARVTSAVIASVIVFFVLVGWLLIPGDKDGVSAPLLGMLIHQESLRQWALAGVALLLLFGLTLRNLVVGQFASLSGRLPIAYGYMAASFALPVMGFSTLAIQNGSSTEQKWTIIFGIALGIKFVAGIAVVATLYRRNLYTWNQLLGYVAGWLVLAFVVFEAFMALKTGDQTMSRVFGFSELKEIASPTLLALIAFFYTPFVRLGLAPLAMEMNRSGT